MLQTVKDVCKFDPKAIDYALSDQIENLDDLIGHDAKAAKEFFDKTYVTGGMKTLLRQGLQRLAGTSGQAVFELKQAMGGGKTHSMLALGYLAANPSLFALVDCEVTKGVKLPSAARIVAISGRSISRDKHLWGDIADQLVFVPEPSISSFLKIGKFIINARTALHVTVAISLASRSIGKPYLPISPQLVG
jgi:hypothetical protein